MLQIPVLSNLVSEVKKNFGKELKKHKREVFGNVFYINRARIRDIAIFLEEKGAIFINIAINNLGDKFELIYVYYLKFLGDHSKYFYVITEVDKKANQINSIQIVYSQALRIEKEIEKKIWIKISTLF